jgi:hypothetical protein
MQGALKNTLMNFFESFFLCQIWVVNVGVNLGQQQQK